MITVDETVSASRKLGRKEAEKLFREASRVVISKGRKVDEFKPVGRVEKEGVAKMLGSTGNLRAPALRVGKTVLIGFNEDVYSEVFG
jgi:hypothetical protein